jgi:hypothetical protein
MLRFGVFGMTEDFVACLSSQTVWHDDSPFGGNACQKVAASSVVKEIGMLD